MSRRIDSRRTEDKPTCLLAAFLAHQCLKFQSLSCYLSALRHLQIANGLEAPQKADWPRLQYVLKGTANRRLPITAKIMSTILTFSQAAFPNDIYEAHLLWAACCLGYFSLMRSGEFGVQNRSPPPPI